MQIHFLGINFDLWKVMSKPSIPKVTKVIKEGDRNVVVEVDKDPKENTKEDKEEINNNRKALVIRYAP